MRKIKNLGIRAKLILLIIPIVLVLVGVYFAMVRSSVIKLSTDKLQAESYAYANDIGAWAGNIISELNIYKNSIEKGGFASDEEILKYMELSYEANEAYPMGLYMGDDTGIYLDASGWVPGDDWVLVERDWYVEGRDHDTFAFGEPYYDAMLGVVCVSATVRMDYVKAVRVLSTDIYLNYLSEQVASIVESENIDDVFFVTRDSQKIIASTNPDLIDVALTDEGIDSLYGNISSFLGNDDNMPQEVKGDSGRVYVTFNEIDNTDWYIVTCAGRDNILSDLKKLEIIMIIVAIIAAVLLIAVTISMTGKIVKPIQRVTDVLKGVAEGDFSQDVEYDGKENDEVASMIRNMSKFLSQMRETIAEISGIAEWLNTQAIDNQKVSSELGDSSTHQSRSVEDLNNMAGELERIAKHVEEQMTELAVVIEETKRQSDYAVNIMNETVEASTKGKSAMLNVSSGMEDIEQTIDSLSQQIIKANEVTANIGHMVQIITDISDETNLLSLNASIEAARAGESGRGFAVVAEQISGLAENSKEAAEEISGFTNEIRETMERAIEKMQLSVDEVKASAESAKVTQQAFDGIYHKVNDTNKTVTNMVELIERVDSVAGQMRNVADRQVETVDIMLQSAEKLMEHTGTVSANSESVADSARAFGEEAKSLAERMSIFKV